MSELFEHIDKLKNAEPRVAVATLVNTRGTTPRKEGAKMVVGEGGRVLGSVTIGGCVDAQVIEQSADVLGANAPRLLELDLGDEEAWEIGLTCGGTIEVFLEPVNLDRPGDPDARLLREGAEPRGRWRPRRRHHTARRRRARSQAPAQGRRYAGGEPRRPIPRSALRRRGARGAARGQVAHALPRGCTRLRRGVARRRPSWPWSARATLPCRS